MKTPIISYAGKRVYIGIDVHREYFVASCVCEGVVIKRCRMPASAESIISLVVKNYSNSAVQTCYESGYSGFWLHRALMAAGISNIVVHAASIEIAANDRVKTDKRDSLMMCCDSFEFFTVHSKELLPKALTTQEFDSTSVA